jgi:hypothetical protein
VPPITVPGEYDSHTACVSAGYKEGYNVFIAIDRKLAEQQRLFVAFHCNPESSI